MLLSVTAPPVAAEYREDTWLENVIGPELLLKGDEFGCHGLEDVDPRLDITVVSACKSYVSSRINASRWGPNLLSYAIPEGALSNKLADELVENGFSIIGDQSQTDDQRLTSISRNGGSIESGLSDQSLIEEVPAGNLVSMYWIARIDDMNIRRDRGLVEWLVSQDYWFTTWGEWTTHEEASLSINSSESSGSITFTNHYDGMWRTPGTVVIDGLGDSFELEWSNVQYPPLDEGDRNLKPGYRLDTSGQLYLTIPKSESVTFTTNNTDSLNYSASVFNGLEKGLTIAGHHTTNMREWSQDFRDTPLRFTWLIEQSKIPDKTLVLPLLALGILIATPLAIRWVIARDQP